MTYDEILNPIALEDVPEEDEEEAEEETEEEAAGESDTQDEQ